MWIARSDSLVYKAGENILETSILSPDWAQFSGEIVRIPAREIVPRGFDDWLSHFPRDEEIELVTKSIASLKRNPRRIHVAGISCADSIELIREYYRSQGYEDALEKNYIFPTDEMLTASLNLRHILWCEKDKEFLSHNPLLEGGEKNQNIERGIYKEINPPPLDKLGAPPSRRRLREPLYALNPPLRSPHDLRALQQASRMGIIMGIEVFKGDEQYLSELLSREIFTPFQIAQFILFRWEKYGFQGEKRNMEIYLGQ